MKVPTTDTSCPSQSAHTSWCCKWSCCYCLIDCLTEVSCFSWVISNCLHVKVSKPISLRIMDICYIDSLKKIHWCGAFLIGKQVVPKICQLRHELCVHSEQCRNWICYFCPVLCKSSKYMHGGLMVLVMFPKPTRLRWQSVRPHLRYPIPSQTCFLLKIKCNPHCLWVWMINKKIEYLSQNRENVWWTDIVNK